MNAERPALTVVPDPTPGTDGEKASTKKLHPLVAAGRSGDRLEILKASLELTLKTLANPKCADYVKSNLLGKVDSLTASIEAIEAERKRAAEEDDDGEDGESEAWDTEAI